MSDDGQLRFSIAERNVKSLEPRDPERIVTNPLTSHREHASHLGRVERMTMQIFVALFRLTFGLTLFIFVFSIVSMWLLITLPLRIVWSPFGGTTRAYSVLSNGKFRNYFITRY